jgi:hypothetical protein
MKETVKRALDLLRRKEWEACDYASNVSEAADILEKGLQALAAPVQEPVGEMQNSCLIENMIVPVVHVALPAGTKLYVNPPAQPEQQDPDGIGWLRKDGGYFTPPAAPAAQQQWVGLTDEEMYLNCPNWLSQEQCKVWVQQIEAKIKEKNT